MKFSEINKIFTANVSDYIAKGYVINSGSMGGHQGEIAKVDLTDGKEIIRVLVVKKYVDYAEIVSVVVGRCMDKVMPNSDNAWSIVWNDNLKILSCFEFYKIGNGGWYGSKEMYNEQCRISRERRCNRHVDGVLRFDSVKAKKIVLPFVKRQNGCKSVNVSDIDSICKCVDSSNGKAEYVVGVKNRYRFVMNGRCA